MTKNEARILALKLRKNENTMLESEKTIKAIVESNILDAYDNIGIYYPIKNEINILKLLDIYPNKKFYLPITSDEINFVRYEKDDILKDGLFNTKEPIGKIVDINTIDCFIIPCVAITTDNKRIGYGKGYYDRYLQGYRGLKIGICYDNMKNVDVKADLFDVIVDYKF